MTFSSAHAALATNIAPTAKQTILRALILILFRLAAARRNIYSARRPMLKAPIGFASGCGVLFIRRDDGIPRRKDKRALSKTLCHPALRRSSLSLVPNPSRVMGQGFPAATFRKAFCEYERYAMKVATKRALSFSDNDP
jgi:hypothetical protein